MAGGLTGGGGGGEDGGPAVGGLASRVVGHGLQVVGGGRRQASHREPRPVGRVHVPVLVTRAMVRVLGRSNDKCIKG